MDFISDATIDFSDAPDSVALDLDAFKPSKPSAADCTGFESSSPSIILASVVAIKSTCALVPMNRRKVNADRSASACHTKANMHTAMNKQKMVIFGTKSSTNSRN